MKTENENEKWFTSELEAADKDAYRLKLNRANFEIKLIQYVEKQFEKTDKRFEKIFDRICKAAIKGGISEDEIGDAIEKRAFIYGALNSRIEAAILSIPGREGAKEVLLKAFAPKGSTKSKNKDGVK